MCEYGSAGDPGQMYRSLEDTRHAESKPAVYSDHESQILTGWNGRMLCHLLRNHISKQSIVGQADLSGFPVQVYFCCAMLRIFYRISVFIAEKCWWNFDQEFEWVEKHIRQEAIFYLPFPDHFQELFCVKVISSMLGQRHGLGNFHKWPCSPQVCLVDRSSSGTSAATDTSPSLAPCWR